MSRLSLYLLGPPRIDLDGEPIQVDTRKAIALLAYIAINRERHRRDALVNLLWPEYDQAHGRAAFRRTLSALRKAFAQPPSSSGQATWLDVDREVVGLSLDVDSSAALGTGFPMGSLTSSSQGSGREFWLDINQFHAHLEVCRAHGHAASDACPVCLPHLTAAAALYRGDFMSGFGLKDSCNFDDWQFFQSERLRRELGGALEKLVQVHGAQGDLESAIGYARRWLALDRLNERAHSQLMLLYTWSGRRSAALRQYQECVRILESNLDVSPQESTTDLYKAVVAGHAPARPAAAPLPAAPTPLYESTSPQVQVPLSHQAGPAVPKVPPFPPEGERRIVTVVYADIGRSLAMMGQLSPEEEAYLADRFLDLVGSVLPKYGGHVGRTLGTGILGVLGARQIHESDPELAIRAAMEIRREAQALGLRVTAGINTGQVYLSGADSEPAGTVVDLAAHLTGQAQTGQILVGESTCRLARRAFEFIPLLLDAKGTAEPVAAYRVERLLPHPRKARGIEGLRAELIGRDWELARLQDAFAQVLQGQGQMVSFIGEAGVGKSRLVAELRETALTSGGDGSTPLWLEGRCLELGTPASYTPFVDILREYLAWRPEEDSHRRRESIAYSLRRMVERGDLSEERAQEIGPLLGRLLSVRWHGEWDDRLGNEDPEQIRHRTFVAMYDFILALSNQRPIVLVFEDLHWADNLSLDLISLLMEGLRSSSLLMLCVYRPVREHRCCHLATIASQKCRDRYTELILHELTHQQSQQMVESLLTMVALFPSLKDLILAQSQGNPFFIEEVVYSLIDAGVVYREGDVWRARQDVRSLAVPESVQNVILSRVDHLDEGLKRVLQTASVIGRVFRRRVLAHTLQQTADLESALWALEERALIYQERAIPEVEYSFKHVLTREAVYWNVPRPRRQALHRQVAQAIEALYQDNLDEYCEHMAHHYDQGGELAKAVAYLFQAGEKAKRSHANEEAITHFGRGLELLEATSRTPARARQELDFLVALGVPVVLTRGHTAPEVERVYARARELSEHVGDTDQRFHVLMGLRRFYLYRGELGMAHGLGEQLLALAQGTRDPVQLSRAHMMHGETLQCLGEFAPARAHCEQGLALYDPSQRHSHVFLYGNDTGIGCRIVHSLSLWHLGHPDQAAQRGHELLALAQELSHPFTLVYALYFSAILHQLRGEVQIVRERTEAVVRMSKERDFALYLAWGTALRGWALAQQGEEEEGINQMLEGIAAWRAMGGTTLLPQLLASLAEIYRKAGELTEASGRLDEALELATTSGECCWEAELHRLKGDLMLTRGDEIQAEVCFERAIDVARRQGARSWELRAATSLCRLWRARGTLGKQKEARRLLTPVYDWFSEGFDTPDLEEAKALLDALARDSQMAVDSS
jgi:DNA-binding SARP family transcriptional activator/predicted ATPase